jgi:hypothetical protein
VNVSHDTKPPVPDYSAPAIEKQTLPDEVKEIAIQPPFSSPPPQHTENPAIPDPDEPVAASWKNILAIMAESQPALKACFSDSTAKKSASDGLDIAFAASQYNIHFAQKPGNRDILQALCNRYFGREMKISLSPRLLDSGTSRIKKQEARLLETEALSHPLVDAVMKLCNGKIVEIKLLQET